MIQAEPCPYRTDPASTLVRVLVPDQRYKNPGEKYILYSGRSEGPEQKHLKKLHFAPRAEGWYELRPDSPVEQACRPI